MSLGHSPSFVSNGIVTLFDMANPKSYNNSSSTLLTDVVGNQVLTIYGSPTYNNSGYITFGNDQTTQWMQANNFSIPTNDHTISFWFRPTGMTTRPSQTPVTYVISSDTNYFLMITADATTFRAYNGTLFDMTVSSMDNVWNFFTRTRVRTTGVENYYMNGRFISTRTIQVNTATVSGGKLFIGQEVDSFTTNNFQNTQNLNGDFSFLSIHNRALSDNEVLRCFNALRGRYEV